MDILPILTSIIVGYFMGNLMASYLVAKWVMGYDIRKHGTGNAGGSNSFMLMGWKNGLSVGIVDNLKAFIAVYIIRILYTNHPDLPLLMIIAGSMAVVGHIFPFFNTSRCKTNFLLFKKSSILVFCNYYTHKKVVYNKYNHKRLTPQIKISYLHTTKIPFSSVT